MTMIRTLRKLTKVAAELEQLTRAVGSLSEVASATAPGLTRLADAARQSQQTVKGRIERA